MEFPFQDKTIHDMPEQPERRGFKTKKRHEKKAGDERTIARATVITMIGLLLAKMTGFLREMLIVPKFGYGILSDAYINAFQIPDLFYELLVGGAVAAVLTPTLSHGIERNREHQAWRGVNRFMSLTMVVMACLLLVGELTATGLVSLITGSYRAAAGSELAKMAAICVPITRILFLQTFMMMLVSMCQGVLTAYKRFTPASLGVVVYNVAYMLALIFFGSKDLEGVRKVAWGVVLSAMVYLIYQLISARHELRFFRFSLDLKDPAFKRLFALAIPTLLSGSVLHLNTIIINYFANGLQDAGAVTSIRQCLTTVTLPYSVFTVAIGTVMLPNLTGFIAQKDLRKERVFFTQSFRKALFFVLPFALIFAILNVETIQAIFQWNPANYSQDKVVATASVLRWFCLSIMFSTAVYLLNSAFYARKITRLALLSGLVALFLTPLFLYLYVTVLQLGVQGIGMAYASYSMITALMLYGLYVWHKPQARPYRLLPYFLRLAFCAVPMALVLLALRSLPFSPGAKILQLLLYGIYVLIALLTYYLAGLTIRLRETVQLQSKIRQFLHLPAVRDFELQREGDLRR